MDNNEVNVQSELDKLQDRNQKFESYLERFTTGDKAVSMKNIDDAFRDVKKSISKLRKVAISR